MTLLAPEVPLYRLYETRLGLSPNDVLLGLRQAKAAYPDEISLLHKQAGRWRIFRWADAFDEVVRLRAALQNFGAGAGSKLVLSGALEPDLIFLALAAHSLEATLYSISRTLAGTELQETLAALSPTHAFVTGRRSIARWLVIGTPNGEPLPLFAKTAMASHDAGWQVHALWREEDDIPERRVFAHRKTWLKSRDISWVDEGTEWTEGLGIVVAHWLEGTRVVAFPEKGESALRDRREIRPSLLLTSAWRRRQLDEEFKQRLPAPGSWMHKLYRLTESSPETVIARVIDARLSSVLGVPRSHRQAPPSKPAVSGRTFS
jgi:hypothetical protein